MTRKKILLVDDSNTILMMERMILTKGPYDLLTATNGEAAVERALSEKPDLTLMDLVIPKINGFAPCRRIRGEESIKDTPIIMVTTRGEVQNVENGFQAGCND